MENTARTTDPVMIVTGASSGIGEQLALQAAACGYAVVLVARRADRLGDVERRIRATGRSAISVVADVIAADAPARIVEAARRAFGRIDTIVHNAGTGAPGNLLEQTDAQIQRQLALHVLAPIRLSRAALDDLERSHGALAFVGSGLARVPAPGFGGYNLAKAAIRAAAIQLRRELRSRGISVTYVDPGAVDTEFSAASGMQRARGITLADPKRVARAMLRGIRRRARRVNAVPWQTAGTVAGEWFPRLADAVIDRVVDKPAPVHIAPDAPSPAIVPDAPDVERDELDVALEPVARRMERTNLSRSFVQSLLVPGESIDFNETAMRWAGMPNKNERALLHDVLRTLTDAGYLEVSAADRWTVKRAAPTRS